MIPAIDVQGVEKRYGKFTALDGISLTVNEVEGNRFGINVIPHTLSVTTFGHLQPGMSVNLEIDTIARYVARLVKG